MADIVNLRRARKAKARDEAETAAAANRAKFGRSKADKAVQTAEDARVKTHIDRRKLDPKSRT